MTTTISGSTGVNQITDDAITDAKLPAGSVLQVVSTTSTATFSTTSGTLQNTGINLVITPTSSTSKVLVLINASIGGSPSGAIPAIGIRRDATDIGVAADSSNRRGAATGQHANNDNVVFSASVSFLDSPATTSATTYRITLSARDDSSHTAWIGRTGLDGDGGYTVRPVNTITLMEIAG
tara:strand:+ start:104 stop:643 length:540 start_codon:yes stop_codon:yes gene_type:complete